jgi:hypothetical protein
MMVALTVACVLLFLTVRFGDLLEFAYVAIMWCIVPTPVIIFAIYARGNLQAFAIGALVPWVTLMLFRAFEWSSYVMTTVWLLTTSAACGILAVATLHWINANQRDRSE